MSTLKVTHLQNESNSAPSISISNAVGGGVTFAGISTFYNSIRLGTDIEGHTSADDLTIATSGDTGMTIRSGASNQGSLYFSDATSGGGEYAGWLRYSHQDSNMTIGVAENERLRITSGGSLNIGGDYTQTAYKTQITGDLLIQKNQAAYQHPQVELYALNTGAYGGAIKFSGNFAGTKYTQATIRTFGGSNTSGGSLAFFTGNGTEKLRLTSDGKLILSGTARTTPFISGDGGMCIEQSYDGNLRALTIRNKDTDAAAATSMCFSLNRSGGDQDFTAGEIKLVKEGEWTTTSSTVDGAMVFSTILNGTMAEKMRISSGGIVTKPNHPCFMVRNSTNANAFSANSKATWDTIDLNNGSHFDDTNDKFVCPVNGIYFFSCQILSNNGVRLFHQLNKNGSRVEGTRTESYDSTTSYQTNTFVAVVQASANDSFEVELGPNGGYGNIYANFNGYLIA